MKPEDYDRVCRIFQEVCDRPETDRSALLEEAFAAEPHLRAEVEAMLAGDAGAGLEEREPAESGGPQDLRTLGPGELTPGRGTRGRPCVSIPGYELLEEMGRGGMGVIYRARQKTPNRIVALKMIRSGQFASQAEVQRFYAEAQAAAQLDHDGIVPVYEVGEYQGEPFFSMKLVEGEGLDVVLRRRDQNRIETLELLRQVCHAVAHAHDRGVVHRDLKPSNILVDTEGRARVTDFGLAKYLNNESALTTHGDVMGTPGYMSPEQAGGDADRVTAASDVYSLGALLYELLTGRTPIQADHVNLVGTLRMIQEHDVIPPRSFDRRVPRDLNTICMHCLEKQPQQRYANARELTNDLDRFLDGEAIQAKPLGVFRSLWCWARQRPGLAATWTAVAIFYAYHLICYYALALPDISPQFHRLATCVAAAVCLEAWFFQRMLLRHRASSCTCFSGSRRTSCWPPSCCWASTGPTAGWPCCIT